MESLDLKSLYKEDGYCEAKWKHNETCLNLA